MCNTGFGGFKNMGYTPGPGQLLIDGPNVYQDGELAQIGYVDNEDPTRAADVQAVLATGKCCIVSLAQGEVNLPGFPRPFAGAINALEWYPFVKGVDLLGPPPKADAYICQQKFAWPGSPSPSGAQVGALVAQMLAHNPGLILFY
jgi:hypothetical protein